MEQTEIIDIKGSPWTPVPGATGDHIPVETKSNGNPKASTEESVEETLEITLEEVPSMPNRPTTPGDRKLGAIKFQIRKHMLQKYGYPDGCPACRRLGDMSTDGQARAGRLGINHSIACKTRIMHEMKSDPKDRHIVEAYQKRIGKDGAEATSSGGQKKLRTANESAIERNNGTIRKRRGLEKGIDELK